LGVVTVAGVVVTGEINHQSRRSIRTLPNSVLHSNTFFACDSRFTP
jgi:hypothetical protein